VKYSKQTKATPSGIVLASCQEELYPDPDSSDSIEEFETRLDIFERTPTSRYVAGIVKDGNVI
jgi:hypothetical protein